MRKNARLPAMLVATSLAALATVRGARADTVGSAVERTLEVDADGFESAAGHAYARLYRRGDKVTGTPWRVVRADLVGKRARFEFPDLAFGEYALVVHHDVNDNGKIDHNLLGFPSEPLGFSNGFALGVLSGMPTFDKLRFAVGPNTNIVRITVR